MSSAPSASSGLMRFLRHPAVLLLALAWLAVDFALLPPNAGAKKWWRKVDQYVIPPASTNLIDLELVIWRDGSVLRASRERVLPATTIGFAYITARTPTRGWWAPTLEESGLSVAVTPSKLGADEEIRNLVASSLDQLAGEDAARWAQSLRTGTPPPKRTLWFGYFRNGVAAFMGALAVIALLVNARAQLGRIHEQRIAALGQCPGCGFELLGNFADGCPECGWNRSSAIGD